MADVEDVSDALVALIVASLTGTGGVPLNGVQTDVFAGWPKANDLNAAMSAGNVQVSVYPQAGAATQVNRHLRDWQRQGPSAVTTVATVVGGVITFSGTITLPLNVAVAAPGNLTATYAAVNGETLTSLATHVAAACVAAGIGASASGAVVTLANGGPANVTLGGQGTLIRESAREEQIFQITIWAPTDALRRTTGSILGPLLADTDILNLPDTSQANFRFMKTMINDHSEVENLYRRDYWYHAEFPETVTTPGWDVVSAQDTLTPVNSLLNPPPIGQPQF